MKCGKTSCQCYKNRNCAGCGMALPTGTEPFSVIVKGAEVWHMNCAGASKERDND